MRYIVIQKTCFETEVWIGDEDDLVDKANNEAIEWATLAYEVTTAAQLASGYCLNPTSPAKAFKKADAEWVLKLGRKWGWNTPLYRADYLQDEGVYSPEPVSAVEAAGAFYAKGPVYGGGPRKFALMPVEVARERLNALIERFPEVKHELEAVLAD